MQATWTAGASWLVLWFGSSWRVTGRCHAHVSRLASDVTSLELTLATVWGQAVTGACPIKGDGTQSPPWVQECQQHMEDDGCVHFWPFWGNTAAQQVQIEAQHRGSAERPAEG